MEKKTHRPFVWEKGRKKAGATDRTLQLKQVAEEGAMNGVEEDPVAEQAADAKPEGDDEVEGEEAVIAPSKSEHATGTVEGDMS